MSLKFSQGVVNNLAMGQGWGDVIRNSICVIYSGTQPNAPENAATAGTELVRFTLNGGTLTAETRAWCRIVLAGGSVGTDNVSISVAGVNITGGSVAYTSSLALTKAAVINAINSNWTYPDFYAIDSGSTVNGNQYGTNAAGEFYIIAPKNSGTVFNSSTVLFANTTITASINGGAATTTATGNFASATNGATGGTMGASGLGVTCNNGLTVTYPPTAGTVSASGTWSGTASATGTAAWFRILCNPNWDLNGTTNINTTENDAWLVQRIDGTVGTSSADMLVSSTSITSAVLQTISSFSLTVPSS